MKYCNNCHNLVEDYTYVCPKCNSYITDTPSDGSFFDAIDSVFNTDSVTNNSETPSFDDNDIADKATESTVTDATSKNNEGATADSDNVAAKTAEPKSKLRVVVLAFMIISCVIGSFAILIPLAWMLPMTLKFNKAVKNNEPLSLSFKICSLFAFVNPLPGILLLFDRQN